MTTYLYRILLVAVCINQGVLQSDIILSLSREIVPENTTAILTCSKKSGTLAESIWRNSIFPGEEAGCSCLENKLYLAGFLLNNSLYECSCNYDGSYSIQLKRVGRYQQGALWSCREFFSTSNTVIIRVSVSVTNAILHASENGTVSENSMATFTCNTSFSLPPARIRWYRSNASSIVEIVNWHTTRKEYLRKDNVISIEESLNYRVNRSFHRWNVYCIATNWNNNRVISNTIPLFVLFPPDRPPVIHDFTNGSTYKVIENEPASLSCSVEGGNPLGIPEWLCKELLNTSLKETTDDNKKVTTILTWTAKRNQERACICQTMHALSKDFVSVDIDVLYKPDVPKIELLYQNFKTTILDAKLIETQSYRFLCSADGNPLPTKYIWNRSQITETTVNDSIVLLNVQRNQSGTYSCQAQNIMNPTFGVLFHGKNNINVNVDVLYKPDVPKIELQYQNFKTATLDAKLIETQSYRFLCSADGNPLPTKYIWSRRQISGTTVNSSIDLPNVQRNQTGTYSCQAHNIMNPTVGRIRHGKNNINVNVDVLYGASVNRFIAIGHENENPVLANESTSILFTCVIDSNPTLTAAIHSSSGKIIAASNSRILEYSYSLTSCLDSGLYTCSARNEYNHGQQAKKVIKLHVNCKPMAHSQVQDDIRSELNIPATLQFTAIARPEPEFTWEKWTNNSWEPVTNNSIISVSSSGMQSYLTVNNFTSAEVNLFRVIVQNFIGKYIQNYTLQPFAVKSTAAAMEEFLIGVVVGSISCGIVITFGIVFGMILYRKRLQKKDRGTANAERSIDEVSEMNTIADEDTSYRADYEQIRPEQDRGVMERMEQTYEPLRPDEDRETCGQTENDRKEFDDDIGALGCTSPIYTNLTLQ